MLAGIVLSVVLCCQNKKSRPTTTYFGKPQKTKKTKNSIETRRQIIVNILANRGGSWAAAISKMEGFQVIVNAWKPLTIITKCSILDVAEGLDSPLAKIPKFHFSQQ